VANRWDGPDVLDCADFGAHAARGFSISYETPKSEKLELFHLGERVYDHILFLPTTVKGTLLDSIAIL
jgi:hypothetical protein